MRPWQAVAISAGSVLVWWGVRAVEWWPDAVGVLSHPMVLIPLVPVVVAVTLLHRRRLGRLTSRGFVVQAVLWQLVGLARPTFHDGYYTSLLTRPFLAPQEVGLLGPSFQIAWPSVLLSAGWCLTVVWLALVAWFGERGSSAHTPIPTAV